MDALTLAKQINELIDRSGFVDRQRVECAIEIANKLRYDRLFEDDPNDEATPDRAVQASTAAQQ